MAASLLYRRNFSYINLKKCKLISSLVRLKSSSQDDSNGKGGLTEQQQPEQAETVNQKRIEVNELNDDLLTTKVSTAGISNLPKPSLKDESPNNESTISDSSTSDSSDSDSSDSSDEEDQKDPSAIPPDSAKVTDDKKKLANVKLASLLYSIKVDGMKTIEKSKLELAKPGKKDAVKEVPDQIGEPLSIDLSIEPELRTAAHSVAQAVAGDPKETETELLKQLRMHSKESVKNAQNTGINVSNLFLGMKIDRTEKKARPRRTRNLQFPSEEQVLQHYINDEDEKDHRRMQRSSPSRENLISSYQPIDIFGKEPLGIFTPQRDATLTTESSEESIWSKLEKRDLQLLTTRHPINGFEEMIQWTEQGKLWRFPIDNESGMDEEANVDFTEHIFLERYLEDGFPRKGPVRHFMELVTVGLSRNPYISVQRKKEHILWFKNYFEEKKALLQEAGAL